MSLLQSFVLPISGLSDGSHEYEYNLDQHFFRDYENSQISECEISIKVSLDKKPRVMTFDIDIKGNFKNPCDRCLVDINITMKESFRLFVKYSESESQDIEVVHISPDTDQLDLAPYIYEFTHLALPTSKTRNCAAEDYKYCDHQALDKLEMNDDEIQDESKGKLWEQLKNIKLEK